MSAPFKHRLLVYLWNLVNAIIGGVATAALAAAGGHVIGALTFTWRQLSMVAISGGALSAFNYVRDNKLPSIDDDVAPSSQARP